MFRARNTMFPSPISDLPPTSFPPIPLLRPLREPLRPPNDLRAPLRAAFLCALCAYSAISVY